MKLDAPYGELGLGVLSACVGVSLVLWWGVYLIVRWVVE